jgi:hypothetical protein
MTAMSAQCHSSTIEQNPPSKTVKFELCHAARIVETSTNDMMVLEACTADIISCDNQTTSLDQANYNLIENDGFFQPTCHACGSPEHALLKYEVLPLETRKHKQYLCPCVKGCTWDDNIQTILKSDRYELCPQKVAQFCAFDIYKVPEIVDQWIRNGAGQYLLPRDHSAFEEAVLIACHEGYNSPVKPEFAQKFETPVESTERCNHLSTEFITQEAELGIETDGYLPIIALHLQNAPMKSMSNLGSGTLHLLMATKVDQATTDEIQSFIEGSHTDCITTIMEDPEEREERKKYTLTLRMPGGARYEVPFKEVRGRILPDTGSTTTLIDEEFALQQGLIIEPAAIRVLLKDVNNGSQEITEQCFVRLTLTTVTCQQVTITILALCVKNLSHDILLGTRDMERYRMCVVPHLGEARMQTEEDDLIFPMLNGITISNLLRAQAERNKLIC